MQSLGSNIYVPPQSGPFVGPSGLSTTQILTINPHLDRKLLDAASLGFHLSLIPHGVYTKVAAEMWLRDPVRSQQQTPLGSLPPEVVKLLQAGPTKSLPTPPAAAAPAPPPETPEERNERIMRITRELSGG